LEPHAVHPDEDVDWTIPRNKKDWATEQENRELRNTMLMETLKAGRPAAYRSSGNSCAPIIKSGDYCTFDPNFDIERLKKGDIVFCRVLPDGWGGHRYYAHAIHRIWKDWEWQEEHQCEGWVRKFEIGNLKEPPTMNGYTTDDLIYGRLSTVVE